MKKIILFLALSASLGVITQTVLAAEIHTCTVNGKTVYQGKPCAGSKALNDKVKSAQDQAKNRQAARQQDAREQAAKKEPKVGMTTTQVGKSTWGYPKSYSETQVANGSSEFWHYGSGRMIYFRNGLVFSITK